MDSQTVERRAQHQPRLEDGPLVRGLGRYADDAPMAGQAQAYFVRSPHAFADIRSIDTTAAKAVPGVLCVLTAADMDGIGNLSQHPPLAGRGGQKLIVPHRPALAGKTVRHVGEAVAVVVAETLIAAQDAAELVAVDYQERAPAVDLREAIRDGAAQVWPEAPGNIAVDWPGLAADPDANAKEVERVIAAAKHVARVSVTHQRLVVNSMEPRGATASYDAAADNYLLRCCSQSARALPGMYDIPLIDIGVRCVFTNTTTTAPYRGAGRPEANYMLERVVDEAARVTGIDPVRLRRRNFVKPKAMPHKTAVSTTIDSG